MNIISDINAPTPWDTELDSDDIDPGGCVTFCIYPAVVTLVDGIKCQSPSPSHFIITDFFVCEKSQFVMSDGVPADLFKHRTHVNFDACPPMSRILIRAINGSKTGKQRLKLKLYGRQVVR